MQQNQKRVNLRGQQQHLIEKNGIVIIKRKTKFLRIKVNRNMMLE